MHKVLAFLRRDFQSAVSYKFDFAFQLARILIATATFYFLAKLVGPSATGTLTPYGGDYFRFVLIGIAFGQYIAVAAQSFAQRVAESQQLGTLEALFVTQTGVTTIVLASSVYGFLWATVSVAAYLAAGALLFGADLTGANVPAAVVVMGLTITSFSGFGILSAAFVLVFKKGDPVSWLTASLSGLLGGMLFPIAVLPPWLQAIARLVPVTYALDAMRRALLTGAGLRDLLPDLAALALFSVVLLPLALLAFHRAVLRAKRDGTLTHY
jgi:ABC-2 type transport system permease protein